MKNLLLGAEGVYRMLIEGVADFAIFLTGPDGRIESWNAGGERIFGFTAEEVLGRDASILFTEEDRANGAPERELGTARRLGRAEDTRWHLRKDGSLVFMDGVTSALYGEEGEVIGFAKIARDVTDRYRTQQRLAAQLALTNLLNDEQPINITAQRIMQTVCENLKWDIGSLWDVEPDGGMRCIDYWHADDIDADAVAALSRHAHLPRDVGLPGRVAQSAAPVWVAPFDDEEAFPRAPLAARAGMLSAFAFPILHEGRVSGVMEFFARDLREPDQDLLPVMALIGAQIGDYIARRRTAAALRESEERYRVVSETAQDAIFTIDADSTILFCNPRVESLFGWAPEEMIGQKLEMIIPERFRAAHRGGITRYLRTGKRNIPWSGAELPGLHRDGHELPLEISFGEWTDGNRTVFTGFARDISERKRAREEAEAVRSQLERRAEEESSFRHLASALTGAVEMTDVLYEITNRATLVTRADGVYVERIIGPNRMVEVVSNAGRGTPPRGLRVSYPGSLTEEIIERREPVILADMQMFGLSMAPYLIDVCPDCEVLVTPLVADKEPLGALVLLNSRQSGRHFRDPDVVRARTLGDLASLALRRVRLMEEEREAKEKAEAAVRVRDETLGIVSHDLRNPLTKISLSVDLLSGAPPEEQDELVETIQTAARQMDRLIQDLLDVARLEAGRFSVGRDWMDATSIVYEVCASHEPLAAQKGQRIICDVAAPLPEICADRDRLLQVFGNLMGNAIKFTPERGTITVSARHERDAVQFSVIDTGSGIPEADLKNVFRAYWQAKKTAHMGAGLGLAIVRGIVEAHGGQVWAENRVGGGAAFSFTIPTK